MNLATLKATVAAYHQKTVAQLTPETTDLFLVAANNARKNAEKLHNFEDCRCTATLAVAGVTGGALEDAEITPEDTFSGIKEILAISGLRSGTDFVPLDFTTPDISIERDRYELELSDNFWPVNRYPSDAQLLNRTGNAALVQRAGSLYFFPRVVASTDPPLTVYIEGYGWLNDYTDTDLVPSAATPDFLVENGFSYLQWAIIIELNYIFQTFVPRQEGNVGSPDKMLQEAWRDLMLWDDYKVISHSTRSR